MIDQSLVLLEDSQTESDLNSLQLTQLANAGRVLNSTVVNELTAARKISSPKQGWRLISA